jgi:hypothetical protein
MTDHIDDIVQAYEQGLPGWQYDERTMDKLFADDLVGDFDAECPHLAGIGEGKLVMLWRSRELYDPGAFAQERQTTGDCVSHGSRNARDTTRAVEIHIKGEPEEYYLRGATEPTYGARGHGGQGMDPARAARFEVEYGFLFRKNYPGVVDLSKYNSSIGSRWGSTGVPEAVKQLCKEHNVGRWIAPRTVEQARDLLAAGYAIHSGQSWGCARESDRHGMAVTSGSWSHDMATVGYDATQDVYPVTVYLVVNSWGAWNVKPKVWPEDRYGPWPPGSFWVPEPVYAKYFVGSRSIFAYADIKGVPAKKLPDWGKLDDVLG